MVRLVKKIAMFALGFGLVGIELSQATNQDAPCLEEVVDQTKTIVRDSLPALIAKKTLQLHSDRFITNHHRKVGELLEISMLKQCREEADKGNTDYILRLACLLLQPIHSQPSELMKQEAFTRLSALEKTENPVILFNIAHCLQYGNGIEISKESQARALQLYRKAASQNYLPAKDAMAYCLFNKIGCRGSIGDRIEALECLKDAAGQGSQFSALYLAYHFLYSSNINDRQLNLALHYLNQVDDKPLVTPMIAVVHMIQHDHESTLKHLLQADENYRNWYSTIPINQGLIQYLKSCIELKKSQNPKKKQHGKTKKNKGDNNAFNAELEADLRRVYPQYIALRNWLYDMTQDKDFPKDKVFRPSECLALIRNSYKSFEKGWVHAHDNTMRRLELNAFMVDLQSFEEKVFLSEQLVRNRYIKELLANKLRDIKLGFEI